MTGTMLLDTSRLLCCFDADDVRHTEAVESYEAASARVTHNYVVAEFVALAQSRSMPRAVTLEFATALLSDPEIEVVWIDRSFHEEAMRLLQSQLDNSYSLCDAVSFVLMKQRRFMDVLTTDHHFEQAAFRRLLPR